MLLALYLPWATGKRQAAYRCIRINSLLARAQRAFLRHGLLLSRHARAASLSRLTALALRETRGSANYYVRGIA